VQPHFRSNYLKSETRTEPFQGCGRIYYMGEPLGTIFSLLEPDLA